MWDKIKFIPTKESKVHNEHEPVDPPSRIQWIRGNDDPLLAAVYWEEINKTRRIKIRN